MISSMLLHVVSHLLERCVVHVNSCSILQVLLPHWIIQVQLAPVLNWIGPLQALKLNLTGDQSGGRVTWRHAMKWNTWQMHVL